MVVAGLGQQREATLTMTKGTTNNRQQQRQAWEDAEFAWSSVDRKSGRLLRNAVGGLAERIRGTQRKPKTEARRKAERQSGRIALHQRLAVALKRNTHPFVPAKLYDSEYLPHQGKRECDRRVAQGLVGQGYYKRWGYETILATAGG